MRITEIIIEGRHVPVVVAHDPSEAEKKFLDANKGQAGKEYDVRAALKKVRDRYECEIVGDLDHYLGHLGKKVGDGKNSMLTKDNRC